MKSQVFMKVQSRRVLVVFFAIMILGTIGCEKTTNTPDDKNFPVPIEFMTIGQGALHSDFLTELSQKELIVKNEAEWNDLKGKLEDAICTTNNFLTEEIDFAVYQIIAVFEEIKPNDGWSIDITDIKEHEDEVVVVVGNLNGGNTSLISNQPFYITKIPASSKEIAVELPNEPDNPTITGTWKVKSMNILGEMVAIDLPPDDAIYEDIIITIPEATEGYIDGHNFTSWIDFAFEIKENQQINTSKYDQYVENELIIGFEDGVDAEKFADNSNYGITVIELLSDRLNAWLFKSDGTEWLRKIISDLSQHSDVKYAQLNHADITLRSFEDENFQENILNTVRFYLIDDNLMFMDSQNKPLIIFTKK